MHIGPDPRLDLSPCTPGYSAVMEREIGWPLGENEQRLLRLLALLIEGGGAWRFLRAPVVAADLAHYPDPWQENRAGVASVVGRTLWHAHLPLDAIVDDQRLPAVPGREMLRSTDIALDQVDASSAVFALHALGNDDVAGAVSHEVGRAFVGSRARAADPFRTGDGGVPEPAIGSLATVYLGLGVIAANAAFYSRSGGEVLGRVATHEHAVVRAGGLDVSELAFALAVQATVRDDVLAAFDSLRPTQAEQVAAWREVLDDHEAELKELLGIADIELEGLVPPPRPAEPVRVVARGELDEGDLHKVNAGRPVFRYAKFSSAILLGMWGMGIGLVVGGIPSLILLEVLPRVIGVPLAIVLTTIATISGTVAGPRWGGAGRRVLCASCDGLVAETDARCGTCGGQIAGEISNPRDRLSREEELEDAENTAVDGLDAAEPD